MKLLILAFIFFIPLFCVNSFAEIQLAQSKHEATLFQSNRSLKTKKSAPKTQEVNFEEMSLQGQIRNPTGAYLINQNGLKFIPLYDIQKDVDFKIREATQWIR